MTREKPSCCHWFGLTKTWVSRNDLEKSIITINFNWAAVLFVCCFLAYGYYGALSPGYNQFKTSTTTSLIQLVALSFVLIFFGLLAWKAPNRFQDSITLKKEDVLVFFSVALIFFSFSFTRLQFQLYSDEISYAGTAHGQSIFIALMLAKHLSVLDGLPYQYLVQVVSLILLTSLVGLFVLSKRWTWQVRIIIFLIILVLGRLVFTSKGGNGSPHPPLHLIPPFVFGSLFGINDFSFKFSYFSAYIIFITLLHKSMRRVFSFHISYLAALAIGTMPLIWYLSTVVEHSFWAFICFTLVLVEITCSGGKLNFIRLMSFVSIATLMRQPSFLVIIPIFFLFIVEEFRSRHIKEWSQKTFFMLAPTLLFIPFLSSSLIHGTPSTGALGEGDTLQRVWDSIDSGVIWTSIINSIPSWWVIYIIFAFFPLSRKMINLNIVFLIFFVFAIYIYYSIDPSLWGYAKYQAEYAAPFTIVGLLLFTLKLSKLNHPEYYILTCISVLLSLNIFNLLEPTFRNDFFLKTPSPAKIYYPEKSDFDGHHLLAAVPYNYRDAYQAIKDNNLTQNSYSIGATYGVLPEIMNGYSVRAVRIIQDIFVGQDLNRLAAPKEGWSIDSIEKDQRIKVILLGAVSNKEKLVDQFKKRNWSVMGEYKNTQYGSTVVVMRKSAVVPMSPK
jgi:hypothetical protein